METLKTLMQHRTIRKYKTDPIPDELLNSIIECGSRASTTGNMQVYSIIKTRDQERKDKLWEYHFKQDMVKQAPVVLTFVADFNRFNKWCTYRDAVPGYDNYLSFFTAAIDALLVAQNVAVAAEDAGLGICYLGTTTYMAGKLVEFFELPQGVVPITTLVMGYPDEAPGLTDRLPVNGVVHNEKYTDYDLDTINSLYEMKEGLKETAALLEENKLEQLAQIFTDRRYTKKDNVHFSNVFLKVLKAQGFMNQ